MMETDIAGKPLQDFGQFVIGASLQGRQGVVPGIIIGPIGIFKLMLDEKQPCPGR